MHCLLLRGRDSFTHLFDADEPGADVDIADALEVCASLAREEDISIRWLLEGCQAARYTLARMDSELRGELAEAFERAATATAVAAGKTSAQENALALARGSARLSEWAVGVDGTGVVLLCASGPEPREPAARLPVGGTTIPPAELHSLLLAFLRVPSDSLAELLSVAASSAPRARALLQSRVGGGVASAAHHVPPARLRHMWAALEAPHASVQATRAHSMELLLCGVPLSEMAGVMAELEDPLVQRIMLACAMLALGEPSTDTPAFVLAAPTPPPAKQEVPAAAVVAPTTGALDVSLAAAAGSDVRQCFVRFFRAAAEPLALTLQAAEATERTLDDVSARMWGLPAGLAGSFFGLTGDRVFLPEEQVPPCALLRDCVAVCAGCFEDAAVDIEAGTLALRAQPGEALFVLLTPSRRTAVDAPALVVRLLRAHGFPDAHIGSAWDSESLGVASVL